MNNLQRFLVFIFLPLAIIALIILNSSLASRFYTGQKSKQPQLKAQLNADVGELSMNPSQHISITTDIKNNGDTTWIPNESNDIVLSYRIFDKDVVVQEGDRVRLPHAIRPGDEIQLNIEIVAPDEPGEYIIVIDMVYEGVAWFAEQGSEPYRINLHVSQ